VSVLRVGESVVVACAKARGLDGKPNERPARVDGQGRDSGGPYVLVEYENGERELVHPKRVRRMQK
jgi:hypothetical protein